MPAIPFAFSVQHFINSVGADAGFAAIIGLAILVLLYFAQARETSTLRELLEDATDLIQHLEHRLELLGRSTPSQPAVTQPPRTPAPGTATPAPPAVAPAPAPAIAASRTGAPAVSSRTPAPVPAGVAPAAPAGVGAPALSAATRLIPADAGQIAIRANGGEHAAGGGGAAVMAPSGPPPATAAGGANGTAGPVRASVPGPGTTGLQPPVRTPGRTESPAAGRPPAAAPRRPSALPQRSSSSGGRSRFSRVAIGVVTLLAVIAVVVVLLIVTSGGGSGTAKNNASASGSSSVSTSTASSGHRARKGTTAAALTPASVTVTVLNGTSTAKLASTIAAKLAAGGFKQGTNPTNAPDQTHTATIVAYLPHQRPAALLVARALKLGPASVQPVDQSTQAVACQTSSTPCTTKVVVTVGSDLVSTP